MEISWVGFGAVVMVSAVISIFSFVNERRLIYPVDDFGLLQLCVGPFLSLHATRFGNGSCYILMLGGILTC